MSRTIDQGFVHHTQFKPPRPQPSQGYTELPSEEELRNELERERKYLAVNSKSIANIRLGLGAYCGILRALYRLSA
ncbi:MAG: hypothetical protein HRT35_12760 [Algicola sp.]|nr:hypothetical protein [Algicola sp.]